MSNQQTEVKKVVISKWARLQNGDKLQQVVYKTPIGKNKNGKQIYSSHTQHEKIR